jgi:1-acyl-sn-glycerol-3-phosphate acyltransferase
MDRLLRALILFTGRIFYRTIAVEGAEHVPERGPCIVVANHPNGLVDPVIVRLALDRQVAFLSKSTLFANPFGRALMKAFDSIPVFRARDGADVRQNERTFDICRERLAKGGWIVLFPEGTSHSDPSLRPMKTGAARIALTAEAASDFRLGLRILPVGLLFEDKEIFRSRVVAKVGAPMTLRGYAEQYAADDRKTVHVLTDAIEEALSAVVLEAGSMELWNGFLAVAAWTHPEAQKDVRTREARARALARAYHHLSQRDPESAEAVVSSARRFAQVLRAIGVEDPFSFDVPQPPSGRSILLSFVPIVLLAPFAALGTILCWPTYRLIALIISTWKTLDDDLTSTVKALAGMLFYPLTFIAEAVAVGFIAGRWAGVATLLLAPALGFTALRWYERIGRRREIIRSWWLRSNRTSLVEAVSRRRRELCATVERELSDVGAAAN